MHIMVSHFSVLSSARFYTLKTEMLRKEFAENSLLCSPTPSAYIVRHRLSKLPHSTVIKAILKYIMLLHRHGNHCPPLDSSWFIAPWQNIIS